VLPVLPAFLSANPTVRVELNVDDNLTDGTPAVRRRGIDPAVKRPLLKIHQTLLPFFGRIGLSRITAGKHAL